VYYIRQRDIQKFIYGFESVEIYMYHNVWWAGGASGAANYLDVGLKKSGK
jgi:hypothetical protein